MSTEFKIENDLPKYGDAIEVLSRQNNHFANISRTYSDINQKIAKMEKAEHFTDEELESLKKQRLFLKDEILSMLEKFAKKPIL